MAELKVEGMKMNVGVVLRNFRDTVDVLERKRESSTTVNIGGALWVLPHWIISSDLVLPFYSV